LFSFQRPKNKKYQFPEKLKNYNHHKTPKKIGGKKKKQPNQRKKKKCTKPKESKLPLQLTFYNPKKKKPKEQI